MRTISSLVLMLAGGCDEPRANGDGDGRWFWEVDGHGLGDPLRPVACCGPNPDHVPIADDDLGSVESETGSRFAGASAIEHAARRWSGEGLSGFGGVLGAGDLDGDGRTELFFGVPGHDGAEMNAGGVWVLDPAAPSGPAASRAKLVVTADQPEVYLGLSADGVGDVTGSGGDDLLIAGRNETPVFLLAGPPEGRSVTQAAAASLAVYWVDEAHASADLDGDGRRDLVLFGNDGAGQRGGYVFRGPIRGELDAGDAWARLLGESWWHYPHRTEPVDLDGDGRDDLAVSVEHGDLHVLTEIGAGDQRIDEVAHATLIATSGAGRVHAADDVDGDGYGDLLVDRRCRTTQDESGVEHRQPVCAALVAGPVSAGDAALDEIAVARWESPHGQGGAIAAGGDLDGDGRSEVVLRQHFNGGNGAAYLFYGPVRGTLDLAADADAWFEDEYGDPPGWSARFVGDLDEDGRDELLFGSYEWEGQVWLVLGGEVF